MTICMRPREVPRLAQLCPLRRRRKRAADGYTVHYARVPRLFADRDLAHEGCACGRPAGTGIKPRCLTGLR